MKALAGLAIFIALAAAAPAGAVDDELLHHLHGSWHGPDLAIAIDTERLQGTDPDHPFRWEPLPS